MTPRQAPDQRMCPPNSPPSTTTELSGHNRRSEGMEPSRGWGGCGLVMWFSHGDVDEIARPFCDRRGCPDCGPRRCARWRRILGQELDQWLATHPGGSLFTYTLASAAWGSHQRKLARHKLPYQQLPLRDGITTRVITTDPLGRDDAHLVVDHHQVLAEVFTWTPADQFEVRRVSHPRWATKAQVSTGEDHGGATPVEDKPKRELIGFVGHPYFAAQRALEQMGYQPEAIPEVELPDDWAEAHRFVPPPQGTPAWNALAKRLRLRPPTTKAQDKELRAYRRRLRAGHPAVQDRLPGMAA
jgi:hypothetical protein